MQTSNLTSVPISRRAVIPRTATSACFDATETAASGHVLQSQSLLKGGKTVQIVHHDQVYVLQATRQGKLILTK